MWRTVTNIGTKIDVAVDAGDDEPYFTQGQAEAFKAFYDANGYVVVRNLVPGDACDRANAAFDAECLPSHRYIYRQESANPERHVFTRQGFVQNAILNVQSIDDRYFPAFRRAGVDVIASAGLQRVCCALMGEPGKIVQSMYFHGNASTWPHQDTYYLDAETPGTMCAAWIATEDIAPGAGRFFVCPGSQRIDMARNGGDFNIAVAHDRYKKLVVDIIASHQLRFVAPALAKGDVLFWSAKTIHGSLPTTQPQRSRRSFTAHLIPQSSRFLQYQSRIKPLRFDIQNGMPIARPKDQARAIPRAILFLEARFPRSFQALKRTAVKASLRS